MARIFLERRDSGDDLRRLARWLEDEPGSGAAGECTPPIDVLETAAAVEVVIDLPGVPPEAIRVIVTGGTLVVSGKKRPKACPHGNATFHLAERCFGQFVRAVRLSGAFDAGRATATLAAGELRLLLPRIDDRRGRDIDVPVTAAD